jgi:hypothetical protein
MLVILSVSMIRVLGLELRHDCEAHIGEVGNRVRIAEKELPQLLQYLDNNDTFRNSAERVMVR